MPKLDGIKKPNPTDKHIGGRIRMRRMLLSMSQETLANALGLTFQQVQKYEKGANRVGGSRMQQIALTLQVPVSFFFEGAPKPDGFVTKNDDDGVAINIVSDFLGTTDGLNLVKAFTRIKSKTIRRRLVELAEGCADA